MFTLRIHDFGAIAAAVVSGYTAYKIHKLVGEIAKEKNVQSVVQAYDEQGPTLRSEVIEARVEDGLPIAGPDDKDPRPAYFRYRAGRRVKMVNALALQAYFQFGHRPTSEANVIITRKFMRDELEQYKDLRSTDAAGIIDSALYLSFLPSEYLREANQMVRTRAFHERARDVPGTFWQRWNPFSSEHEVPVVRT